ncbi:MAG: hypothetical protein IJG68_07280 [Bacilli bacterium]|nr:hypothetical protein [Bacilli bacterium]
MAEVRADEKSLNDLKNALMGAGEDYREKLAKVTAVVTGITSGSISGDPATDLVNKFEAKRDFLNRVLNTINEAEDYMGIKKGGFQNMMSELKSGMK